MRLCNENCNECPIILHTNSRLLTKVLNEAFEKFGDDFYAIVQQNCPNMTCCRDCHIDDFCHVEGCKIIQEIDDEITIKSVLQHLVIKGAK